MIFSFQYILYIQDEQVYKKPRPETTGRGILPVVPPELPQKRSLLSRCNVRNTSLLLRHSGKAHAAPLRSHTLPFLNRYPLGLLLGSVIHTDSDMRLSPYPHSLGTKFHATSLRLCILFVCIISLLNWIVKRKKHKKFHVFHIFIK